MFLVGGVVFLGVVIVAMLLGGEDGVLHDWERREATQPMELGGRWLGMTLVNADSREAQRKGIYAAEGVAVLEISERDGWRATYAGVMTGDVIGGVDGKRVRHMEEFYDVSLKVDVAQAVLLDVLRGGQQMTLVLPSPSTASNQAGTTDTTATYQGATLNVAAQSNVNQRATTGGRASGPYYLCPNHGTRWHRAAVHPHYRCPLCNELLGQVP